MKTIKDQNNEFALLAIIVGLVDLKKQYADDLECNDFVFGANINETMGEIIEKFKDFLNP